MRRAGGQGQRQLLMCIRQLVRLHDLVTHPVPSQNVDKLTGFLQTIFLSLRWQQGMVILMPRPLATLPKQAVALTDGPAWRLSS